MDTSIVSQMSLFRAEDAQLFVQRIKSLTPENKPMWGKMNVGQMLAHCQEPLKVALGDLVLKRTIIGFLLGGIAKKKILGENGFGKNSPTHPLFVMTDKRVFEREQSNLIALVERLHKGGASALTKETHPFFGRLSPQEWDALQSKHLDHHLRQFGV